MTRSDTDPKGPAGAGRHIRAVIFDLDGCLVDSEPLVISALADELAHMGVQGMDADSIRAEFLGRSITAICQVAAQGIGPFDQTAFVARFETRLLDRYRQELHCITGAADLLQRLDDRGIPMAIGTGGSIARMQTTLRISGLDRYFPDTAFSADQVARGKPAPDLFVFAAENLNVAPEACIVIEDSPHGVRAARDAGMIALGFTGGAHLTGIKPAHRDLLQAAGAAQVCDDLADIYRAIAERLTG
jgi:HAD superfamily hydrolase (TIGR01509 family)